jgi:hypothetical protein
MINNHLCAKEFCWRGILTLLALHVCFSTVALGANNITGAVRNQSRGEPAVGDEVILLRLDTGMPEETRAKIDSQGIFALNVQYPDKPYLVRVIHQGVNYDQQAAPGQFLSIDVFDAAPKVRGVTGTIEILRTGTNGNLLHVSDMVEIKNASNPPLTQVGERTFEVYLSPKAKIDSVLAAGPGRMWVMISAASVPGEPGHFTVNFPLQPGATKFAFNYDLPYDGHAAFQTRHAYRLQQFAVMIPPTMKFSSRSPAFAVLATDNNRYQVQAANQLKAGAGPEFEVSGSGPLPQLGDQDQTRAQSQIPPHVSPRPPAPARAASYPLAATDPRLKQAQPSSQSFVLAGLTAVLVAACALLVWRARKARNSSAAQSATLSGRQRQRSAA